jgi:hypothetical protein
MYIWRIEVLTFQLFLITTFKFDVDITQYNNSNQQQPTATNTHKMISTTITSTTSNENNNDMSSMLNVPTKLNNIDSLIRGVSHQKPSMMANGYIPSNSDICCGRGKQNWNMAGNVNFRKLIRASVARYIAAPKRNDKTAVVISVFDKIRRQGGHFLKQQQQQQHGNGCWYDIGDTAAREKVGHSLRDQVGKSARATKSPLQLAKEHTRRAAAPTGDCDSEDSTDSENSADSADFAAASLTETSSLSSLSPSPSSSSCTEETILDFVPVTTMSLGSSSCSAPIVISGVMWGADLLPTNSSQLLLSDFLVGCYDL